VRTTRSCLIATWENISFIFKSETSVESEMSEPMPRMKSTLVVESWKYAVDTSSSNSLESGHQQAKPQHDAAAPKA
jgi:hypothetical protein